MIIAAEFDHMSSYIEIKRKGSYIKIKTKSSCTKYNTMFDKNDRIYALHLDYAVLSPIIPAYE